MKININNIFKSIIITAALLITFLFARNNRYEKCDARGEMIFDKWTCSFLIARESNGKYYIQKIHDMRNDYR